MTEKEFAELRAAMALYEDAFKESFPTYHVAEEDWRKVALQAVKDGKPVHRPLAEGIVA